MSAAHCIANKTSEDFYVHVGLHDILKIDNDKVFKVKSVFKLSYENPSIFGDFSLIELEKPIKFIQGDIKPACSNFVDQIFQDNLLSAGWGNTARTWQDLKDKSATFHHPPKQTKMLWYYFSGQIQDESCPPNDICIKARNPEDSVCHRDSWGPLMLTKNGKTSVVGITSYFTSTI